ncbi:dinuclear metal center protein, YbgI/SA1388 family [Paenibacillus uliginis N3/975]|uniref:GTP cyclohydrolase 1 type 2 homolog n=1 Tax=Paenibacillus uliginis N3/975 TaxID=1313296 RepID=A0A1X7HHW9_9BACL|nr:Nif3-like dinuclear metal center hexameric protein [Paenibacillus uliginis]SMF86987.1 dinuclear metal center protein, YbgI/SA1388 family [Paenibacillus uliginis N3/975]
MNRVQLKETLELLFGDLLQAFEEGDEYAFYPYGPEEIKRIGYATNITVDVIKQAAEQKVQLLLTHHDAWDFIYGMKEECHSLLMEHQMNHFFVHLPLDYAPFGTCNSLFKELGMESLVQVSSHQEGRSIPGTGELTTPISFETFIDKVRSVLDEDVKSWKNSDRLIKRVGIVTGAGNGTDQIRDAVNGECDVYITGEKNLYTVQYAQYVMMNLIVGSHTFTEIFGVKSLAEKIAEHHPDIEIVQLVEEHIE